MTLKVVKIGNSQGIRLPKPLLEQCGIKKEVEVEAIDGVIVLRPIKKKLRKGWNESFKEMARLNDDKPINDDIATDFDEREWEWA